MNSLLFEVAKEGARAAIQELIANGYLKAEATTTETPGKEETIRGTRKAAAFASISTSTFQRLKNEGKIKPSYTIGGTHFYTSTDLMAQVRNL